MNQFHFDTRAVHAGEKAVDATGSHVPPIYQTSTFVFSDVDQGARRFAGEESGYIYTRLGNPTVRLFETMMADLEGGEDAAAFASGMGAISAVLLQLLSPGDHIVSLRTLYGCTYTLMTGLLKRMGIETTFVDGRDPENFRQAVRPETRLIYIETPANPNMALTDLKALGQMGRELGIPTVVDNTFMTPYLQRPLEHGIDLVVHSATKYLGGHGDVVAGVAVGSEAMIGAIKEEVQKDVGASLGPFDAWLLIRGIKTLPLRMMRHCESAFTIAKWLEQHPKVDWVAYPGLESHPQHALALRQHADGFGGMISFELKGGFEAGKQLLNHVQLCTLAVSLGTVDTLIQHPASMTHSSLSEDEQRETGITPGLIRLSPGLEHAEDIILDLKQALEV